MAKPISRRKVVNAGVLAAIGLVAWRRVAHALQADAIVVYKDPGCGCCSKWIEHLTANGFKPSVINRSYAEMEQVRVRYKVPEALASCHTAVVGGFVIEGHVPADLIHKLLKEKPKVVGLTIPGMPQSAPGMDLKPHQPYEVLAFDAAGKTTVYARR